MTATTVRPLPGIRFEAQPPPSPVVLPRMDVAAFVGFATAGPIDVPVPVEDPAQYAAIFGDEDAVLGWDAETAADATSLLGPAVRAFFANGGSRCFVVRVGLGAETASFEVPGLLVRDAGGGFARAALPARSPGSWADAVAVGSALEALALGIEAASLVDLRFDLTAAAPGAVAAGDLLRLTTGAWTLFVPVRAVEAGDAAGVLRAHGNPNGLVFLDAPAVADGAACTVDLVGADRVERAAVAAAVAAGGLVLDLPVAAAPAPGAILLVDGLGSDRCALVVTSTSPPEDGAGVLAAGTLLRLRTAIPPERLADAPELADRLTWELWTRQGDVDLRQLDGLGFAAAHPRWPGRLPPDDRLFDPDTPPPPGDEALWREVATPRLALAGDGLDPAATLVPFGLDLLPSPLAPPRLPASTSLVRDGLAAFAEALFYDAALADTRIDAIGGQADAIRYLAPVPRRLHGLHALYHLDEVTIAAVPDAVQRRWSFVPRPPLAPSTADPVRPHPDETGFHDCALRILAAPVLALADADENGRFVLAWTATDTDGATYVVDESPDPAFVEAVEVYRGPATTLELHSRGAAYYRVYAEAGANSSDWSNAVGVDASPATRLVLEPADAYDPGALLAVQRALMRLCAARGDVVCTLALPGHLHEDAALAHAAALAQAANGSGVVPPLDASEQRALSHAALYHPWPLERTGIRIAPDGPVAGTLAARATRRGAWIAAANEPLRDVVALAPPIPRASRWRLQDGRVNLLRQEPHGFVVLDQDTLSPDEDLRPLNVRRLLCLLRRLVLLYGPQYVFESNDAILRRSIQRGFENVLGLMFDLGAFAGADRASSFQVLLADPPNSSAARDAGELIVELKVAPSRPLAFLTVRLVNAAAGLLVESS